MDRGDKRNRTLWKGGKELGKKRQAWVPPRRKSQPWSQVLSGSGNCLKAQLRNPEGLTLGFWHRKLQAPPEKTQPTVKGENEH